MQGHGIIFICGYVSGVYGNREDLYKMILIKEAAAIIVGDKERRVLYDADILIEGARIKKIGRNLSQGMRLGTYEIIDGRHFFIYPRLVNTHHHFFQAFIRNNVWLD